MKTWFVGVACLVSVAAGRSAQAVELTIPPAVANTPAYQAETARNRELFAGFLKMFYVQHDVRKAFATYVSQEYIQHHPGMADGPEAAVGSLAPLFARSTTRTEVRQVLADGDRTIVEMVGHQGPKDPGVVVINIFRWKNGKIVEHWDVTQAISGLTPSGHTPY